MGTNDLRLRDAWQTDSGGRAGVAEKKFYEVFSKELEGTDFCIRKRPNEFRDIYSQIKLNKKVIQDIYNPGQEWVHGLFPDFAIDNIKTGKTLYVEVKRQDGWVEGKPRRAGRGNAHERSCKFFTPGLLKILREQGKMGDSVLPFWVVFQGDIARDPKRVREITCWYGDQDAHFFMWSNNTSEELLVKHFNNRLKPLLR